jgi:hypothetical protein
MYHRGGEKSKYYGTIPDRALSVRPAGQWPGRSPFSREKGGPGTSVYSGAASAPVTTLEESLCTVSPSTLATVRTV